MAISDSRDNIGEFQHAETGRWFTYRKTKDHWSLKHGLEFEVDTIRNPIAAKVLKTVAYVAVDENERGEPVIEKWPIKGHRIWNKGV